MSQENDGSELLPVEPGFREADAYQLGIAPDGGITISMVAFHGDRPLRFAMVTLPPDEADALARVLAQRREAHAAAQRGERDGKGHWTTKGCS